MARLIDADELKKNYPHDSDWEYPVNTNEYVCESIDNAPTIDAIPIPKGATNGDMIKAMFPNIKIHEHEKTDICDAYIQIDIWDFSIYVSKDWWNAPYKED